jgi:hypothetical protein
MAVDFWADKYWNGQYFNVQYFGTGEVDLNAMSGSAHGTSTATGNLTFINHALETYGGAWLPIIYVKNKSKAKRQEIAQAVKEKVTASTAREGGITYAERRKIALAISAQFKDASLRLEELEQLTSAFEKRAAKETFDRQLAEAEKAAKEAFKRRLADAAQAANDAQKAHELKLKMERIRRNNQALSLLLLAS